MKEYHSLFLKEDRILGVLMRGTDYSSLKLPNHPIPPSLDEAVEKVKEMKDKWNCNKVFLATEDYNIVLHFKEAFGDDCKLSKRPYINYDGKTHISLYHLNRENDFYLLGKEYLTQIVILSKCNCLITMKANGAIGALMMSDGFEQIMVLDAGNYPPPSYTLGLILRCFLLICLLKSWRCYHASSSSK